MTAKKAADFEEAIAATKFGLYNLMLMAVALPATLSTQLESTALSFVLPAAQCDLNLSLQEKGALNAMVFAGMLTSGFLTGFLTDVIGRRKILVYTFWIDAFLALGLAFATNTYIMLFAKFVGGFVINGAAAALPTYIAEFHGKRYRSKVPLMLGLLYNIGNIILPLIAWAILPMDFNLVLFNNYQIHAWNLFLFVCCLPPFIAGTFYYLMPESPKFLMTEGHNDQALVIFQNIYRVNTRETKDKYPIDKLIVEQENVTLKKSLKMILQQILPLFSRKYIFHLLIMCLIIFFLMMNVNTLRLWLPQIFQTVSDYENYNNKSTDFCTMLETISSNVEEDIENCTVNTNNAPVYVNSAIVGFVTIILYLTAASLINIFGKKTLLGISTSVAGVFALAIYFAPSNLVAVIFICLNIGCSCVCLDVTIAIIIDLFPTNLRASALSLSLLSGRLGALIGNLAIPYLLQIGCGPPFFSLTVILLGCSLMSLLLPSTHLKSLE